MIECKRTIILVEAILNYNMQMRFLQVSFAIDNLIISPRQNDREMTLLSFYAPTEIFGEAKLIQPIEQTVEQTLNKYYICIKVYKI